MGGPMQRDMGFWSPLICHISIPKYVEVQNWRLGVVLRLMQLLLLAWLMRNYVTDVNWAFETVKPDGFFSFWANSDVDSYHKQMVEDNRADVCRKTSKMKYVADGQAYQPDGCTDLAPGDEWSKGESTLFIPTYFSDTWLEQMAGDEDCLRLQQCCGRLGPGGLADTTDADNLAEEDGPAPGGGGGLQPDTDALLNKSSSSSSSGGRRRNTGQPKTKCSDAGFADGQFVELRRKNIRGQKMCRCTRKLSYFVRGAEGVEVVVSPYFRMSHFGALGLGGYVGGSTYDKKDNVLTAIKMPEEDPTVLDDNDDQALAQVASPHELPEALAERRLNHGSASRARRGAPPPESGSAVLEVQGDGGMRMMAPLGDNLEASGHTLIRRESEAGLPQDQQGTSGDPGLRRQRPSEAESMPPPVSPRSWSLLSYMRGHADPTPETKIDPGNYVTLTLGNWLEHAVLMEGSRAPALRSLKGDATSILDAPNRVVGKNEKDNGPTYPSFRMTGIELTIDMSFQNWDTHKRKDHNGTLLEVNVLARGGWHSRPVVYQMKPIDPKTGETKVVQRAFYGVVIKFRSGGQFSFFSFIAIGIALSSIIVYMGLPAFIINSLALNALGDASTYYWAAARQICHPKDAFLGLTARTFALQKALMGANNGKDTFTEKDVEGVLKKAFVDNDAECRADVQIISKMLVDCHGDPNNGAITVSQVVDACLNDEMVNMDEADDLYVKDIQKVGHVERVLRWIFLPASQYQESEHANRMKMKKKREAAERKKKQLPPVEEAVPVEFTIVLTKTPENPRLGVDIDFADDTFYITQVTGGLVQAWNTENPDYAVQPGDRWVVVNGLSGSAKELMEACKAADTLEILVQRQAQ